MAVMNNGEMKSNKLNRELLRWIQSLDLAYSIKNVKRDFANGFLVAEILSRYYDKDISMHSYDNGTGMKVRKDNWDQLAKFFPRYADLELLTNKGDMDAVIHCQNGAAVDFLTKLYQCLTKRIIQPTVVPSTPGIGSVPNVAKGLDKVEEIPPYAKPTNSTFIRDKMRGSDFAEIQDQTELYHKIRDMHLHREETHHLERLMADTSDRNSALRTASKATVLSGAIKPVISNENDPMIMTQQIVREVQIKEINQKGLEKLRATREANENESSGHSNGTLHHNCGDVIPSVDLLSIQNDRINAERAQRCKAIDLLNETVSQKLASMGLALKVRGKKESFENFVENVYEGNIVGDQECVEVLQDIRNGAGLLARSFLDFPREFWKFTGLMYFFLAEHNDSHIFFREVVNLFLVLGQECVLNDASAAALLMPEILLPKFTAILRLYPTKRAPVLRILYAFLPNTVLAHIQAIKHLRETLCDDIPLFIHLLTVLIGMESELDDTLVDLYHYYCCIGLQTSCEKLRAACLSMLIPLMNYDFNLLVNLLPRLTLLSSRHAWWEVKAQLLVVASAFLRFIRVYSAQYQDKSCGDNGNMTRDFTEDIEMCLTIIEQEFHPKANLNLRRVGLSYLANNLENFQELVPLYVDVLFSLPTTVFHAMMFTYPTNSEDEKEVREKRINELEHQLPVRGACGEIYQLLPLVPNWDSVAIVKQVFYEHKSQSSTDPAVLLVMLKCVEQLVQSGQQHHVRMLYDQINGYVSLGFASTTTCELSASIVQVALLALDGSETDIFQHVAFIEALQHLVTSNTDDIRQQTVVKLLQSAQTLGPLWAERVQHCVLNLRAMCDIETFKTSLFFIALC